MAECRILTAGIPDDVKSDIRFALLYNIEWNDIELDDEHR